MDPIAMSDQKTTQTGGERQDCTLMDRQLRVSYGVAQEDSAIRPTAAADRPRRSCTVGRSYKVALISYIWIVEACIELCSSADAHCSCCAAFMPLPPRCQEEDASSKAVDKMLEAEKKEKYKVSQTAAATCASSASPPSPSLIRWLRCLRYLWSGCRGG
jgi:hypothetical protein